MKISLIAFLILSFAGIAVFGVFAMDHGSDSAHPACIATATQGADCPKGASAFSFLTFHLDAFRNFSTSMYAKNFGGLLLLFFSFLLVFRIAYDQSRRHALPAYAFLFTHELSRKPGYVPQHKVTRWLSLHENSPTT